jgi:hypothetical protein
MSDQTVLDVLDDLERILAMPLEFPNPDLIARWHEAFKASVAGAERGPRWPEALARARTLGRLLKRREELLRAAQDRVRRELNRFTVSRRALNGYRSSPV